MEKRPPKDEYYLEIAKAVAQRSPCIRRKYGAVIVKKRCHSFYWLQWAS